MQEAVTWIAVITSAGSVTALFTFWMRIGAQMQKAESANTIACAALAKVDLLSSQLSEYKVKVALEFASADDLKSVDHRLVTAVDNLGARFDRMADRLDRFFELMERRGQ